MSNHGEITFTFKRSTTGYLPVVEGNDHGGYFGGQKVFNNHPCKTIAEAKEKAEKLYWSRLNDTKW